MTHPPGYSSDDLAKPPSPREWSEEEKDHIAFTTWFETGSLTKVKRALGVKTDATAITRLNRAIADRREMMEDRERHIFELGSEKLLARYSRLEAQIEAGDDSKHNEANGTWDRIAKLHGLNRPVQTEVTGLGGITVFTGLPQEVIEGQVVTDQEAPQGLPDGSDDAERLSDSEGQPHDE